MADNVIPLFKGGLRCADCKQSIDAGDLYCEVTTPVGFMPVHLACMKRKKTKDVSKR